MATQLTEALTKMLRDLAYNDRGTIGPILAKLEEGTKIRRDYIVHGVVTVFVAYLILGRGAELVCNLIGFVYPAYASIKAIQSPDSSDDTQWLTYWVVYAFFSVAEFASDQIVGWFPFYWLTKFLFLLWLYLPMTRGAEVVYTRFIVPFMEKYSARLAEIEKEIREQLQRHSAEKPTHDEDATIPNGDSVPVPELPTGDDEYPEKDELPVPVDANEPEQKPIDETPVDLPIHDVNPPAPQEPLPVSVPETVNQPTPIVPQVNDQGPEKVVNEPTPTAPEVHDHGPEKDEPTVPQVAVLSYSSDSGLQQQKE